MRVKICTKCGKELLVTEFSKGNGKDGLYYWCKECCRQYYENNKDKILECQIEYYQSNKEKISERRRRYDQSEKGRKVKSKAQKKYQQSEKGRKTQRKIRRKYRQSYKGNMKEKAYWQSEEGRKVQRRHRKSDKGRKTQRKYQKLDKGRKMQRKQYETNKLSHCMANMIRKSLKRNKSGRHWETLVPYTLEELKQHLEGLFQPGMSWNNYGKWHIDHKIPKSKFQFTNSEDKEFQECWALENLQPLWAEENWKKSDSLD